MVLRPNIFLQTTHACVLPACLPAYLPPTSIKTFGADWTGCARKQTTDAYESAPGAMDAGASDEAIRGPPDVQRKDCRGMYMYVMLVFGSETVGKLQPNQALHIWVHRL